VIAGIVPALRELVGSAIELQLDLAPALPRVLVDPSQLEQILLDLASNGRDAMPDGGRLSVTTGELRLAEGDIRARYPGAGMAPGVYVSLAVSDSGTGMSPDVLEHVFEPFFTTRTFGKGVGLGLAVVYGAVKQNSGYIWASSEAGRGSRFEILLAASDAGDG
jgi:Signal transduction histidine kinase regulating C4-dicarboxylate transport system